MYWAKVFTTKTEFVVALCDKELLGKILNFKQKRIKVKVSERFYGGEIIDELKVVKLLEKATVGNLIGKSITELAAKNGYISKENIILIDGIPHAQFVKLIE